jgi:hypothetical protein
VTNGDTNDDKESYCIGDKNSDVGDMLLDI